MSLQGGFGVPFGDNLYRATGGRQQSVTPQAGNAGSASPFSFGNMDSFSPLFGGLDLSHADSSKLNIVEIDDFNPEKDQPNNSGGYFNHGETVGSILQSGGIDSDLGQFVDVNKVNIDTGESADQRSAAISQALSKVIISAMIDPSKVDAVNISQQDAAATQDTQDVRNKIRMLQEMGVPVVIAADNLGSQTPNQLAYDNAFVVQSTDSSGKVLDSSGPGNLKAEGRSTSFAAPELTPVIAEYKKLGYSVDQIQQLLQQNQNGGFQSPSFQDVYTANETV